MLLQQATNASNPTSPFRRLAGWSESWYDPSGNPDTVRTDFIKLCRLRAGLLATGASVVGQRYQEVDPVGPSSTGSVTFPGAGRASDVPNVSLYFRLPASGARNQRPTYLRGIPDGMVVEGEYSPDPTFTDALNEFIAWAEGYYFFGRVLSNIAYPLVSIDTAGNFVTTVANTLADTNMVRVSRSKQTSTGILVGGVFKLHIDPTSTKVAIQSWPYGASTGGTIRLESKSYFPIARSTNISGRIVSKKVGRPFVGYRGRASNSK